MSRELKPCGTVAAYERHRRRGEEVCEACREARRVYSNAQYVPRDRDRPPCGTTAGYHYHIRHGEQTCRACRDAWNARHRSQRLEQMISAVWAESSGASEGERCAS